MYIQLNDEIIKLDINSIEKFYIERSYYNCIDDDSRSGFQYCLMAKGSYDIFGHNDRDIKQYESKELALEDLNKLAERLNAIKLNVY